MANLININNLKSVLAANANRLAYINLRTVDSVCSYSGWISNFNIYKRNDQTHSYPISLDLSQDNDLFMLFALASCWSRSGQFENATYFILYLIENNKNNYEQWLDTTFVDKERNRKEQSVIDILGLYEDIRLPGRKRISFRTDFFDGVHILAKNWKDIKNSLVESERNNNYSIFVNYIRSIGGIGGRGSNGKMSIKIPLILRELRVAGRYENIPGEWCCVPDERVKETCRLEFFNIDFSTKDMRMLTNNYNLDSGIKLVLNRSQVIYSLFEDLYDIPLFAYPDLHSMGLI